MRGKTSFSAFLLVLLGFSLGYVAASRFQPAPSLGRRASSEPPSKAKRNPAALRTSNSFQSADGTPKILTFPEVSAAFQAALANPKMDKRFEALTDLAQSVAIADILQALRLAETIPNPALRNAFVQALIPRWAEKFPAGAMQYVENLPLSQERKAMILEIAGTWAEHSPEEALAWSQKLSSPELRR